MATHLRRNRIRAGLAATAAATAGAGLDTAAGGEG